MRIVFVLVTGARLFSLSRMGEGGGEGIHFLTTVLAAADSR